MTTTTPDATIQQFARHLNEGDLDAALALYEPDATFLPDPGSEVTGLDAIRAALEGFFALRPTLAGDIQRVVEAGCAQVLHGVGERTHTGQHEPIGLGQVGRRVGDERLGAERLERAEHRVEVAEPVVDDCNPLRNHC